MASLGSLRDWCPWIAGLLLVGAVVLHLMDRADDAKLEARATQATQNYERAVQRADSLEARADSVGARADSLRGVLGRVRARERRRRDSLEREAAEARERLVEAREGVARGDSLEKLALRELARRVTPELRPVVREAVRGDSIEDASRDSVEAGLSAEARFERQMRRSVEMELAATREELTERRSEVKKLRETVDRKTAALDSASVAIGKWRDLAEDPWWQDLLGNSLLESGGKLAGGILACQHSGETCLGYVGANGVDFALGRLD